MATQIKPVERPEASMRRPARWHAATALVLKAVLPIAILAAAALAVAHLLENAPVAERKARPRAARLVETVPVEQARSGPVIHAWGEVVPARRLLLRPEVSGTVIDLSPELAAGGHVSADEVLIRLDDRELRLAEVRAEAEARMIEARILLEEGQQALGQRDLDRLSRTLTDRQRRLILREPQMAELHAELAAARAAAEQAALATARTSIRAPFDALVISEEVTQGTMLTEGAEAAELVAADEFHVVLAVPAATLDWINLDGDEPVTLSQDAVWPKGTTRTGTIKRLAPDISETGRMVELIVSIADPLAFNDENAGAPPVLLGAFLAAEITGTAIDNAVHIDRAHLRDNNTVWVMREDGTLEVRQVEVAWRGIDHVLIESGLEAGEQVIATHLATFADGMAVRTRESQE